MPNHETQRQDCVVDRTCFIIWSLPISSFNGHFKPLRVAWLQHCVRTNQLHNMSSLNDPIVMLEPTSDNAFAWCRVHKSVMAVNNPPLTHKCDTFTHLQPNAKGYKNVVCTAAKWVHAVLSMRRAGQANKTVRPPFVSNATKRTRRYSHRCRPRRRTRRPWNNEARVSTMTSGVASA